MRNYAMQTLLHVAASLGLDACVALLLQQPGHTQLLEAKEILAYWRPLHFAAARGPGNALVALLNAGVAVVRLVYMCMSVAPCVCLVCMHGSAVNVHTLTCYMFESFSSVFLTQCHACICSHLRSF